MTTHWQKLVMRWKTAGVIDSATAERIRLYEERESEGQRLRWPVILAVSFGGLMLAAGVLLFVAAHWDKLSPALRFTTVLILVALFHVLGAAIAENFPVLSWVFHAVGTACLGAGIFLAAQIFNLEEDWSGGFLLWAIGAALGWALLRQTAQGVLTALLVPIWLAGKWSVATAPYSSRDLVAAEGLWLLAVSYFGARALDRDDGIRRWLAWIGGLALIPLTAMIPYADEAGSNWRHVVPPPPGLLAAGWIVAISVPVLVAVVLRMRGSWTQAIATAWVVVFGSMGAEFEETGQSLFLFAWHTVLPYLWCLIACVGMIAWGLREKRKERINLGVAGFGITVGAFYFSSLMDKLGRSTSLMGFGVLFIVGGWFLEKARRQLVGRLGAQPA